MTQQQRTDRRTATVLVVLASSVLFLSAAVGAEPAARFDERHRELDEGERTIALEHARAPAERALRAHSGRNARDPGRIEVLRVARKTSPKGVRPDEYRRRADVYVYDYDADRVAVVTVDLSSNRVESTRTAVGVQPPLSDRELKRATELLFSDEAAALRIGDEFARVTGRPLKHWRELTISGFVYHADSMLGSNTPETSACGRHRCAQLLLRTEDNVSLGLPIVDLSTERVLETRRFGPAPQAGSKSSQASDHGSHEHEH